MSRIGRLPIQVPAGVTVTIADDNTVTVKGPKGELSQKVNKDIKVEQVGAEVLVSRPSDSKPHRSMHGLYRSLINNMVTGVTKGFEKGLEIQGVGWRVAEWNKNQLTIAIGYSHPVIVDAPQGIEFDVDKNNVKITVKGIDKQLVGAVAADIRAIRKPEPYHGKASAMTVSTCVTRKARPVRSNEGGNRKCLTSVTATRFARSVTSACAKRSAGRPLVPGFAYFAATSTSMLRSLTT